MTIIGYTDLVSRLSKQSSTLYATNLFRLTEELCKTKDGLINVNFEDDAIRGLTVIKDGEITWPAPAGIPYGTALGATQLNATSPVAGTFVYTPASGTVLSGGAQTDAGSAVKIGRAHV